MSDMSPEEWFTLPGDLRRIYSAVDLLVWLLREGGYDGDRGTIALDLVGDYLRGACTCSNPEPAEPDLLLPGETGSLAPDAKAAYLAVNSLASLAWSRNAHLAESVALLASGRLAQHIKAHTHDGGTPSPDRPCSCGCSCSKDA